MGFLDLQNTLGGQVRSCEFIPHAAYSTPSRLGIGAVGYTEFSHGYEGSSATKARSDMPNPVIRNSAKIWLTQN